MGHSAAPPPARPTGAQRRSRHERGQGSAAAPRGPPAPTLFVSDATSSTRALRSEGRCHCRNGETKVAKTLSGLRRSCRLFLLSLEVTARAGESGEGGEGSALRMLRHAVAAVAHDEQRVGEDRSKRASRLSPFLFSVMLSLTADSIVAGTLLGSFVRCSRCLLARRSERVWQKKEERGVRLLCFDLKVWPLSLSLFLTPARLMLLRRHPKKAAAPVPL